MRILLVSEFFLPSGQGGGVSRHVHDLAKYLCKQGDEVHVLASRLFSGENEYSLIDGTRVIRELLPFSSLSFVNRANGIYASYDLAKKLRQVGGKYDIVHVHSGRTLFLHRLRLPKPIVATVHGVFPICIRESARGRNICKSPNGARCTVCYVNDNPTQALIAPSIAINCLIHYRLMRKYLMSMQKIVCVSDYIKQQIGNCFDFLRHKMITISNGVDVEAFKKYQPSRIEQFRREIARSNEKIILFVGRLVYTKGVHVLIAAMPKILDKVDAKLVIVGARGHMAGYLEEQVHRAELDTKVSFAGSIDDQKLQLLYKSADVSVVPSLYEPFGITAIEAFAAQTPLVVADSGGLSEIVEHNRTGVKVIPNNVDSLAEGILKILLDPSFAQRLRSNAYQEVLQKYSWERIGQQLRSLYKNVYDEYSND